MYKFIVFLIIQLIGISHCKDLMRELDARLNPNCPSNICNGTTILTIVHTIAKGQSDSLHYIWDLTGKPSVLIALTTLDTNVTIDWTDFMDDKPNSVRFSSKPYYTSTLVLNKFWQFNDAEDTGKIPAVVNNSSEINSFDTANFTWTRINFFNSLHNVAVTVTGDNTELLGKNGKIKLKLKCFSVKAHDVDFPHLLLSENATQFDIVMENVKFDEKKYPQGRLGVEMMIVSQEPALDRQSFDIHKKKSLDDEHTPGIFELIEIASPESFKAARGSYIQYRPVSYTHPARDVSTSTELQITKPVNLDNPTEQLNGSLAWSYYGNQLYEKELLVQGFNVSFGMSDDGFYTKTNYTTWTFVMGYGAPPNEQLSMFVVIVASIGLGLPLLLLVGGCLYICIKRARNR